MFFVSVLMNNLVKNEKAIVDKDKVSTTTDVKKDEPISSSKAIPNVASRQKSYDNNEKLQYEGKCKLILDSMSKLLLVEPVNEDYKMISAMFKWKFVVKKNILFVFAEHSFQDFAIIFDQESRCQKLYEILVNKNVRFVDLFWDQECSIKKAIKLQVEIGTHDLILNRFIPSLCTEIEQNYNPILKEIFVKWIQKLEDSEKEKFIQILKERNIYDLLFFGEKRFLSAGNGDVDGRRNLRKRKAKDIIYNVEEQDKCDYENGENENNGPISKKNKYSRYEIIIEKQNYEIISFEVNGVQKSRLFTFTSSNRNLCYEYYYQNCTKKYHCGGCAKKKSTLTAKICCRRNGENIVRLSSSEHLCEMRKYDPSKYTVKQKIVKEPYFRTITYYQRGSPRTKLIVFDSTNPKLCYEYFWYNKKKCYLCCGCISKDSQLNRKIHVEAKICQGSDGMDFVKLGRKKHVCKMREFYSNKFNDDIKIYKPNYELFEGIIKGKETKFLYIFTDNEKKFCYKFFYRPKYDKKTGALLKRGTHYCCSKCHHKKHEITAVIRKDENGQDMVVVKNKKKHICEPIEFVRPKEWSPKIVVPPNYQLIKRRANGKIVQHLVIFDSNDKSLCYEYTWNKSHNWYQCYSCKGTLKTNVYAKIKTNANGEEYVELGQNEHKCALKKFMPENIILKEPDFKLENYIRAGKQRTRILVFDKTKKGYYFVYCWKENETYICHPCRKLHKTVGVKLCQNENGQNYIEINDGEHLCESRNKF